MRGKAAPHFLAWRTSAVGQNQTVSNHRKWNSHHFARRVRIPLCLRCCLSRSHSFSSHERRNSLNLTSRTTTRLAGNNSTRSAAWIFVIIICKLASAPIPRSRDRSIASIFRGIEITGATNYLRFCHRMTGRFTSRHITSDFPSGCYTMRSSPSVSFLATDLVRPIAVIQRSDQSRC
jgi:hypothetical protein